jgi:diaminopimelate epimerase
VRGKGRLTEPAAIKTERGLTEGRKVLKVHCINTGVPHAVVFSDDVEKLDVERLGRSLRFRKTFMPEGTNVDFVEKTGPKEIKVRTYERGVEAETYACGTGAAASAIIACLVCGIKPHVDVTTKSGEVLRIYFDIARKKVKNVYLEGESRVVYKGVIGYV